MADPHCRQIFADQRQVTWRLICHKAVHQHSQASVRRVQLVGWAPRPFLAVSATVRRCRSASRNFGKSFATKNIPGTLQQADT